MGDGNRPGYAAKANKDYRERTADPLGVDMANTTFVFVTPRRWDKKKAWEKRKRDQGKWRDRRVVDGDDIEQALEKDRNCLPTTSGQTAHQFAVTRE